MSRSHLRAFLLVITLFSMCLSGIAQVPIGGGPGIRFLGYITSTTGTVQCSDNTGNAITHQQYAPYAPTPSPPSNVGPVAVIKGNSFTINAQFWVPGPFIDGVITLNTVKFKGVPITASMPTYYVSSSTGFVQTCTIQVGPVPNYVDAGDITVEIDTDELDTSWWPYGRVAGLAVTNFRLYVVYDQPTAPQVKPWVGVLEDACLYARFQATEANVAGESTRGVFYGGNTYGMSPRRFYYPASTAPKWIDGTDGKFKLTNYLATSGWQEGNCRDVSTYLGICTNALGLSYATSILDYPPLGFDTNLLCAIGSDPLDYMSYGSFVGSTFYPGLPWGWDHHSVLVSGSLVFDACAAQWATPGGSTYQNPPAGWTLSGSTSYWTSTSRNPLATPATLAWFGTGLVSSPNPSTPSQSTPVFNVK